MDSDYGLVNCASCHRELTGERQENHLLAQGVLKMDIVPPVVGMRLAGRPYCSACAQPVRISRGYGRGLATTDDDASDGQELAIRRMEDS